MTLETLRESLPPYAKDLSLNLSTLASETALTEQQKWGCFLASAYALGSGPVIRAMEASARAAGVPDEALQAAKGAAAIMGMNNVYYRALHLLRSSEEYRALPARLRMTIIGNPGVDKLDFELWSMAVSAVNGCGMCMDAHEHELKKHALSAVQIQTALRIASVVNAVSRVVEAEAAAKTSPLP
jgi:alkyl hydroperoxide reductase subunit D